MENNVFPAIQPLRKENYEVWALKIEAALTLKGLKSVLDEPEPANDSKDRAGWAKKNNEAVAYIRLSLSDEILMQYGSEDNARNLWLKIKEDYTMAKNAFEKKLRTLIIIILDESGSMESSKNDVIGGYNSFLDNQKGMVEDDASLIFIKFNSVVSVIFDLTPIDDVPRLDGSNYKPGGSTALYDAIGHGVKMSEKVENKFDRFICVIMTDGEENCSRTTTKEDVTKIISGKQEQGNWTFVYIGENPEKWAKETGQYAGNVVNFSRGQLRMQCSLVSNQLLGVRSKRSSNVRSFFSSTPK